jgi:hypothetical protein
MLPRKQKSAQQLLVDFKMYTDNDMSAEDRAILAEALEAQERARVAMLQMAEVTARAEAA